MSPTRASFLRGGLLVLLSAAASTLIPAAASAAITDDPPEATLKKMLEAVKTKSYDAFLADADDAVRAKLTRQNFEGVSALIGPRLKQGYKTSYLTRLRKEGFATHLWKLEFSDGKDEALVTMSVKDGKVAGIFIN
jgi:hypothetical protein